MGGLFSKPSVPAIPQQVVPPAPKQPDEAAYNAGREESLRRRRAYGSEETLLTTGTLGASSIPKKTLLGQ